MRGALQQRGRFSLQVRVGITAATEEPRGGTIARDLESGEPNGLLLEMESWLEGRIPPLSESELGDAVSLASGRFLSQGVTSVVDATASNSLRRWDFLRRLKADGRFAPSLSIMPAANRLSEFEGAGLEFGYGDDLSTLGHAKIVLTQSSGRLFPQTEDFARDCGGRSWTGAFRWRYTQSKRLRWKRRSTRSRRARVRDCATVSSMLPSGPADALEAILNAKPVIVSQPEFLQDSGARYLSEFGVAANSLYRFKTLLDGGITVAASSDAPVSAPNPLASMQTAITRRAASGEVVGPEEGLTALEALEMHTSKAAYAACIESEVGSIAVGRRADLVVLSDDPTAVAPERMLDVRVTMTVLGGERTLG